MMAFRVCLKKTKMSTRSRLSFDIEKLRNTFKATIWREIFTTQQSDNDINIDSMITTYNTAVIDTASEVLGKELRRKKWRSQKLH